MLRDDKYYFPKNLYLVKKNDGTHIVVKAKFEILNQLWLDDKIEEFNGLKVLKLNSYNDIEKLGGNNEE